VPVIPTTAFTWPDAGTVTNSLTELTELLLKKLPHYQSNSYVS
jgi:hypothetical protein